MSNSEKMKITTEAAPVRSQVAASFRSAIVAGRFGPGERLIERELCELTGASRTSVREALRQLESEGLVETVANKGPIVTVITPEQARKIYEVREALESFAGALFVRVASDSQLQALKKAVNKIEAAYESRDLSKILSAKDNFYNVLFKGSGNEIIGSIIRTMNARISLLRRVSLDSGTRATQSLAELREILICIEQRDETATALACQRHVKKAAEAALSRLVE